MKGNLSLAVVGCGGIAQFMALLAWLTPGVKLAAACDISRRRAEIFARKFRIPAVFTDYGEMLSAGGYDAVYLAVPHDLHFEMIRAAVDEDFQIFTEKPITRTFAEGEAVVAYAAEKNIKIGVNYQYRYDSGCHRIARAVQSGVLGRVLYARINVSWHRERKYFDDAPWHKSLAQAGGGTLITQGSHLIDVVLWAVGSPPVSATGITTQTIFRDVEVEDYAAGTVTLENGATIQITSSMVAAKEQPVSIEIYGERGIAIYSSNPLPRVKFIGINPKTERPSLWGFHALHRSLKGFRNWVLQDEPYLIPGEEALPALKVVEAIYQSAETGQRVEIQ
ncbi:MAG: Gfo/Idh/MocA family protein [Anaerolineales bacterium]|jgi:predicted dehydrogenase